MTSPVPPGLSCTWRRYRWDQPCAQPPVMPPGGWPEPDTPAAADLLCERHQQEMAHATRRRSTGVGAGILVAIVGVVVLVYLGRNYPACQNILVQAANQQACQNASLFHWGGIGGLIIGAAMVAGGLMSRGR